MCFREHLSKCVPDLFVGLSLHERSEQAFSLVGIVFPVQHHGHLHALFQLHELSVLPLKLGVFS